ncbi:T-lymphoma invasion and metastasis-inducing protein 1 [Myotis brandtii]|uniref:T-lymphoma invasion and metastasis-inducing protein 1 n=1 Tax=Myotis brandtii TaxID=109478 RepID=S7ML16_MYOBR|nr:T-lymphoma invasion and metastasis-inducing protein 1 [Myotis brandtii]
MDEKMKKMGEMQLSSVTDSKKKKTILDQIFVWEQNLEQFQMDLFRYRCYLASLQGGELPNPKRLLAFASRPTKVAMGRLGIFSVSSFHALTHQLDPAAHYLRLRFLVENRLQVYVPQPEEDVYELLYQEIEICPKATRSLQVEKSDAAGDSYGFSLSSVEEDGVRRLYVSSVRDTGLAAKKGPSLGGAQGSGAEPAPEEAEGLDPESSDDTDLSSKDLNCLMERYLKPLQKETFLTQDELDVLFGNLTEMVEFQVEFLKTLEDGVRLVPDLEKLERVDQFKKVLFSLGGSFLYYADRFKLYSAFCASHTKVPKVLVKARTDAAFKAFLDAQNPRQQHSATLESYLIKPIQRVLKYPLLLRELFALTHYTTPLYLQAKPPTSHPCLAIKTMNKVASHINEMQKIHEEFGAVFDQLIAEQTGEKKEVGPASGPLSPRRAVGREKAGTGRIGVAVYSALGPAAVWLLPQRGFLRKGRCGLPAGWGVTCGGDCCPRGLAALKVPGAAAASWGWNLGPLSE